MITYLDHIYSHLKDNDLEKTLAKFARAGFIVDSQKVRHPKGELTGFVMLTGTYLEFISVVDEADFLKDADSTDKILRADPHPYGVGAVCLDPQFIYDQLSPIYPKLEKPYSRGAVDRPDDIRWTFCPLPEDASPGAYVFPLKYHKRNTSVFDEKKGPNSIFGMAGFYFCSDSPSSRMDTWTRTLEKVTPNFKREDNEISFGCQKLHWLTKIDHAQIFGNIGWDNRKFLDAEICGVRLLAESLTTAKAYLEQGGFNVRKSDELNALVSTDPNSAFTLVIEESDSRKFLSSLNELGSKKIR